MRVFITGAAGFIGSATVQELIKNGHQVLALARSDANIEILTKLGAEPHKGDLEDLESLKSGAKATDGVIHLAFIHDFSNFAEVCATDRAAIEAMAEVLAGTGKPLIIASGTLGLPKGTLGIEDSEPVRDHPLSDRALSADLVYATSKRRKYAAQWFDLHPQSTAKEIMDLSRCWATRTAKRAQSFTSMMDQLDGPPFIVRMRQCYFVSHWKKARRVPLTMQLLNKVCASKIWRR